jgi:hypothetical protein
MNFAFQHLAFRRDCHLIDLRHPDRWRSEQWKAVSAELHNMGPPETDEERSKWAALDARREELESPKRHVAFDAGRVADGAGQLFVGLYSCEPTYFADNFIDLPWAGDYHRLEGEHYRPTRDLGVDVMDMAVRILRPRDDLPAWPNDIDATIDLLTVEDDRFDKQGVRFRAQVHAVEAILCAEGALRALAANDGLAAAWWLSCAYKRLIDAANVAEAIARQSDSQRRLSHRRHRENYELREVVLAWYRPRHDTFRSADAAAEAVLRAHLVPGTSFRTIRDWIAVERKKLRSAGRA